MKKTTKDETLSPTVIRVLRMIVKRPSRVTEMVQPGLSEATIHRATSDLRKRGLVVADDGVQSATDAAHLALEAADATSAVIPTLPIPALGHLPTTKHRAFVEIGLCAAAARTHLTVREGLPGIIFVGEPGAQKTRACRALIAAAVGDPYLDLVEAALPSGRGVFIRHDARGDEVSRSHLLSVPVAVFDECDKIEDPVTRRMVEQAYFHGTAQVVLDKDPVEMKAMPVAVMNPLAVMNSDFEARTGFHHSIFRRVIYADFATLKAPKDHDTDWLKEFFATDSARKVKLPKPRTPSLDAALRIRKAIDALAKSADVKEKTDEFMLAVIAKGATAWLDDEAAIRLVVFNWALLIEATGVLVSEWQLAFKMHFAPKETKEEIELAKTKRAIENLCHGARVAFKNDLGLATDYMFIASEIQKHGLELASREGLTNLARALVTIATALKGWKRAHGALSLRKKLREINVTVETARELAVKASELSLGDDPEGASYLLDLGHLAYTQGFFLTNKKDPWKSTGRKPPRPLKDDRPTM